MTNSSRGQILLGGFKFPHHSDSSGYHQLAKFINGEYLNADKLIFGNSPIESNKRQLNYLLFEMALSFKAKKFNIVHYLYPEQHLFFSVPKNKKTVSVATIHLDEQWLNRDMVVSKKFLEARRSMFEKLDGIICLSREQEEKLKEMYPSKQIKFIPHGINNLVQYSNFNFNRENLEITVVGSNYRDMELLFEVIETVEKKHKGWRFNLIGLSKEWKVYAAKYSNTIVHPFLTEEQYFSVLQSSHIHLLPVKFATANNALLEAHALGVPSITSNCKGVKDYSLETTLVFNDKEDAINKLEYISSMSDENYSELRKSTLDNSRQFSWEEIAKRVTEFYSLLQSLKRN